MKHKVVTITCAAVILALFAVAVVTHRSEIKVQFAKAQAYATQQAHDAHQKVAVAAEKKRLSDECHKLQTSYDAQSVAVKKTSTRPVCDLPEVQ